MEETKKEKKRLYYEANKERLLLKAKENYEKNKVNRNAIIKKWQEANKEKVKLYASEYSKNNKEKIKGYSNNKDYYEKNKATLSVKSTEYRNNNKDSIKLRDKLYYENNKREICRKQCEYIKNRRLTDPLFRLQLNIRTLIRKSFTVKDYSKPTKTINILGCTIEEFKLHLESKFESWMSWDNYGLYNGTLNYGWDIDHIIPLCTGNTIDVIYSLNHYSNLQPLCSYTNRNIKKDKYEL